MSSSKAPVKDVTVAAMGSPPNMVTPIADLKELGALLAKHHRLGAGVYDLVLEYRFGGGSINLEADRTEPAMAIALSGIGLRQADKIGPMSIEVSAPPARARKTRTSAAD